MGEQGYKRKFGKEKKFGEVVKTVFPFRYLELDSKSHVEFRGRKCFLGDLM